MSTQVASHKFRCFADGSATNPRLVWGRSSPTPRRIAPRPASNSGIRQHRSSVRWNWWELTTEPTTSWLSQLPHTHVTYTHAHRHTTPHTHATLHTLCTIIIYTLHTLHIRTHITHIRSVIHIVMAIIWEQWVSMAYKNNHWALDENIAVYYRWGDSYEL